MLLKNSQNFHFVGIGGIGMSGIAYILHEKGFKITGSDVSSNATTEKLKNLGIPIYKGHKASNIKNAAVIITSTSITNDNAEVEAAKKKKIPIIPRAHMLSDIMKLFPHTVSVSGSHGKTTTTALIGAMLEKAELDPTVINGGIVNALNSNSYLGKSEWCVTEADESDGSFLKLPSTISVITNIDHEHLNYYGSFEKLVEAFKTFLASTSFLGFSVICLDDPIIQKIIPSNRKVFTYGFHKDAQVRALNIRKKVDSSVFDISIKIDGQKVVYKDITLSMLGTHNIQNTLAAITIAYELGISEDTIRATLENFHGVQRRFTCRGIVDGIYIIDDYAHHPKEVEKVLECARQKTQRKVIGILQPHRYTRLKDLMQDFANILSQFDHVILMPVYAAGESPIENVNSHTLLEKISCKGTYLESEEDIPFVIKKIAKSGDIVVFMGAGTITNWAKLLPEQLKKVV